MNYRVIFSDNGTLKDLSTDILNYHTGAETLDYVAAEDHFYIGTRYPMNSIWVKMDGVNVNDNASTLSIDHWDGQYWRDMVEVIDETAATGKSLAQSGYMSWVPNKKYGYSREDTVNTSGVELITGLGNITIYDLFWHKLDWSADLTNTTALKFIGNLFSNDEDLASEYPGVMGDMIAAFETGKTNYEEQHVRAAELLVNDLVQKKIINSSSQLLDRRLFTNASLTKVAELIYKVWGDDYDDKRLAARNEYKSRLKMGIFSVDRNQDARLNTKEASVRQGKMIR